MINQVTGTETCGRGLSGIANLRVVRKEGKELTSKLATSTKGKKHNKIASSPPSPPAGKKEGNQLYGRVPVSTGGKGEKK